MTMFKPLKIAAFLVSFNVSAGLAMELNMEDTSAGRPAAGLVETPSYYDAVAKGELPPVQDRVPEEARIIDMEALGKKTGRHGGTLRTLIGKAKDIRLINVNGYARLVGFNHNLELEPDILKKVAVQEGRIFTFHLRKGHKWSDGAPFTTEDFRYFWEDIALNEELSPAGPPVFLMVDGERPTVEVLDETRIRFTWSRPNLSFLPTLAQARPPFIYRPSHYLKKYHEKYGDPQHIAEHVAAENVRNWAALHNREDNMYKADNISLPTLQPWFNSTEMPSSRFQMVRNPFYHRVDSAGQQLPYIDDVMMTVASAKLIPAKANAGEVDLQARGLGFSNITILKQGEKRNDYRTFLWPIAKGSHFALYPNLNQTDAVWRKLLRDVRFRRALSLGIDRHMINRALYFGLASEGNNTALSASPLYHELNMTNWATYDPEQANQLLDEVGLTTRDSNDVRLLPDGRPLELIIETAGENTEQTDILQLIAETWREIGVKIFIKPSQRDVLRTRAYAGQTVMTVWEGFDNGVPTADMSPREFAPLRQDNFTWPKWGQYYETKGQQGEAPDLPAAQELATLATEWSMTENWHGRNDIWKRILSIHAEQLFSIGVLSGVRQPVVVSRKLHNVPEEGVYGWDPGAQFGIYKPDTFWFED